MQPKPKSKRGAKPYKPTDEDRKAVMSMSAVGITQGDIAKVIAGGIDEKTLRKHFREELDTASIRANSEVGGHLFNKAKGGDTTAMIWWTKTRMGWKETNVNEHAGAVTLRTIYENEPKK